MISLQAQADAIAASYTPPDTGRPSDISDPILLNELFQRIRDGNYLETACDLVGLSHVTVYAWKKRGEAGERPFDAFAKALKEASAQAEAQAVANVRKAGQSPQFWAAEMTYLERRHPDRWARRQDDASVPKVVVQIGARDSDVRVLVQAGTADPSTFASESSAVSEGLHRLSGDVESYNNELCKPTNSLQVLAGKDVASLPPPLNPARGLTAAPRKGTGTPRSSVAPQIKGRRKKKGHGPA